MAKFGSTIATLVFVGAVAGCRRASPPFETFEARPEAPLPKGAPAAVPPNSALQPWRVWINQEQPRQKKAPTWASFAVKDARLLDMAPDGRWRCLINPGHLLGKINEHAKVGRWIASRTVRCSSDGWRTHVEALVHAEYSSEGELTQKDPAVPLYLNDVVEGQPRRTVVVLEALGTPHPRTGDD